MEGQCVLSFRLLGHLILFGFSPLYLETFVPGDPLLILWNSLDLGTPSSYLGPPDLGKPLLRKAFVKHLFYLFVPKIGASPPVSVSDHTCKNSDARLISLPPSATTTL